MAREILSDREALLLYYNELLVQNEISSCKRRKVSESDTSTNNGLLAAETRNQESCLDSPSSSTSEPSDVENSPKSSTPIEYQTNCDPLDLSIPVSREVTNNTNHISNHTALKETTNHNISFETTQHPVSKETFNYVISTDPSDHLVSTESTSHPVSTETINHAATKKPKETANHLVSTETFNCVVSKETTNNLLVAPEEINHSVSKEKGNNLVYTEKFDQVITTINANQSSEENKVVDPDQIQSCGAEQGSYPCPHCEKHFAYTGNLKRHIKMHHGEYRPYKCSLCVKRFWGSDSLEQHTKRVHTKDRPYACAHCEKKYSVCYDLQKHVRSVHGKDIDWEMEVPTKEEGHIDSPTEKQKVTGIKTVALDQLQHKCKFCNRGFATVNGLGVHLKMHFRCKVCFKGFNTEESLRTHMQKAHDMTGEQEYVL